MIARTIDLNGDLGELPDLIAAGVDRQLLSIVTSANIACGGHAGDERTMRQSVRDALAAGVAIGAHPSYPDRPNFGRAEVDLSPTEIEIHVRRQVEALGWIAHFEDTHVRHVKPHGALYHAAMERPEIARLVARGAWAWSTDLILVGQAGRPGLDVWRDMGAKVMSEAFADRRYEPDGRLRQRSRSGAVLADPHEVERQAVRIATGRGVVASDGTVVPIAADTICVHGDTPGAVTLARRVRLALEAAGVRCTC